MPQPDHISVFDLPEYEALDDETKKYFDICVEKLGMVPNVLATFSFNLEKLRNFSNYYNTLMLAPSGLSKLEREMVAVVVSSANRCFYCLVAHGQTVRALSGDPELGEMMVMNYRVAKLSDRQRAMLDFAWKLTKTPFDVGDTDREALSAAGLSQEEIFDLADVIGFFNMSNRFAIASDMMPNREYHGMDRSVSDKS
ncbi:peroxidase-related enzyme [Cognatishimia activa]|uniref:Putative peroxidase-related enzyme n=1 Tax=Cognatishimia activa TaxID=1715691 RepID=A0A0P1IT74_9RHOB|nr:peroxidase-related enzyme [Cognatishimia activa]CUI76821.1 putative peroxidase-related enzyme [Cognatishimia activa]CUK26754.1 putative peroxidase-related enzyme [Cognatishimia activa]